jgi:hypothetical protein
MIFPMSARYQIWSDYDGTAEIPSFMVKEQNIKLLSNAEFLLQIQLKQVEIRKNFRLSVLEFNLNNMSKNMSKNMDFINGLNFEISLNVEFSADPGLSDTHRYTQNVYTQNSELYIEGRVIQHLQDFDVNLTQNFGTTFMSKPFDVITCKFCDFKLVFKLPHDSMMDTTMSKLFTEAGEY